jgi:hypothetical protein
VGKLKEKWGEDFEKNVGFANAALQEFGGKEIAEQLENSAWGKYPPLVELLSAIGKGLTEKPLHGDGAGALRKGPEELRSEIASLRANPAFWDKSHPEHKILVQRDPRDPRQALRRRVIYYTRTV